MPIDYETEYNNRARVKEHPEILARLTEAANAYRTQATAEGRVELGASYGASPRQVVDLFFSDAGPDAPLAMFIHGGYWRSLQPQMFSSLARGLNMHGVTVALAAYDLCPEIGIGDRRTGRARFAVPVGSLSQTHPGVRPFRRRTSRGSDARDRLAHARRA